MLLTNSTNNERTRYDPHFKEIIIIIIDLGIATKYSVADARLK